MKRVLAEFKVPGKPHGKALKVTKVGKHGRISPTKESVRYMDLTATCASVSNLRVQDGTCLVADIEVVVRRPLRPYGKKDTGARLRCRSKPDVDNVSKAILDGLRKWFDDKDVTDEHILKRYADPGEEEHVKVTISAVPVELDRREDPTQCSIEPLDK